MMRVSTTYNGFIPKMPQRMLNSTLRDSYTELGEHFFETNLPRRFTVSGAWMLGYAKRSPRYTKRKEKKFGHVLPLVYSGETRQRALSESFTRIKAIAKKGVGSLALAVNVPALNFKHPKGPNTREEFERIADREIGPLEIVLEKAASRRFGSYAETQSFKAG